MRVVFFVCIPSYLQYLLVGGVVGYILRTSNIFGPVCEESPKIGSHEQGPSKRVVITSNPS
jgi:hypothetical protein